MPSALILVLALVLALLGILVGLVLVARFLTGESEADKAMRFDPFATPSPPPSVRFLEYFFWWRRGPRRITYRRDRRGRFRKHRR